GHSLRDRHEQIVEHLEHDRVGGGADGALPLERDDAIEHEMVLGGDFGAPAVLDHDGLVWLDDDGGATYGVAGRKLLAGEHRGLVPFLARIKSRAARGGGERGARPR